MEVVIVARKVIKLKVSPEIRTMLTYYWYFCFKHNNTGDRLIHTKYKYYTECTSVLKS